MSYEGFFPHGPPPPALPPTDHDLIHRILKLVEYAARNGPSFVEQVRLKQAQNSEFAFLHGGEGSGYFLWALHSQLCGNQSGPLSATQHHPGQPPPPPPPPTFDPFSFPPGLIPRFVSESVRSDPPYTPLNPLDIEASAGPPPPPLDDPYLQARIDRFYAQLGDYRPGNEFSDIETTALATEHHHFMSVGPNRMPPKATTTTTIGPLTAGQISQPHNNDGFGMAPGGRGLGYGTSNSSALGDRDDVFDSYRLMRSQGYHAKDPGGRQR